MPDGSKPTGDGLQAAYGTDADPVALAADILRRLAHVEARQARTEGDHGTIEARIERLERIVLHGGGTEGATP